MHIIRAATIFDGEGVRRDHELVITAEGQIAELRPIQGAPSTATVTDHGAGTTLLPGLVDGHQHLSWGCPPEGEHPMPVEPAAGHAQTLTNARRALAAGITTVQDLGDSDFPVVDVRNGTRGDRRLPRILASGPPITSPGGHCHFLHGAQTAPQQITDAVPARAERGVDVIKVMVSGGNITPGSLPWQSQFDRDALHALVTAAHDKGLPVAAHAHGVDAIRDCVACGVDSIEHGTFFTADGVDQAPRLRQDLARSGIYVRATPGLVPDGPPPPPAMLARLDAILTGFRTLIDLHARLVIATDAGIGPAKPHDVMPYAIEQVAALVSDPLDALTRATSLAADALGLGNVCGRLAPGLTADLLVVRGDPTLDPNALRDVDVVYREGERISPSPEDDG